MREKAMETSIETAELFAALQKAQSQMGGAKKDSRNDFLKAKYADLKSIIAVIKEPCANNGLIYTQHPIHQDNYFGVETLVIHSSGQFMASKFLMPMSKIDPQGVGSCITYCRRYALQAIFGIPAVDDDGQAAQFAVAEKETAEAPEEDPRVSKIVGCIGEGKLQEAATAWYNLSKEDKITVFNLLPKDVQDRMKSSDFVTLKGSK
jgi:hypothetical protein